MTTADWASLWDREWVFTWLQPHTVDPVTRVDPTDPLLRHAHCDGSASPWTGVPGDLATHTLSSRIPAGAVVCMTTAWGLHTGMPPSAIDLVGLPSRLPVPGTRTFYMEVPAGEVETVDGVRCTSRLRTAFDLARLAPLDVAAQALTDLRSHCSPAEFDTFVTLHARSRHAARARRLSSLVLRPTSSGSR